MVVRVVRVLGDGVVGWYTFLFFPGFKMKGERRGEAIRIGFASRLKFY